MKTVKAIASSYSYLQYHTSQWQNYKVIIKYKNPYYATVLHVIVPQLRYAHHKRKFILLKLPALRNNFIHKTYFSKHKLAPKGQATKKLLTQM